MVNKEFKVLGHKVQYSVTENSAEFNALDPKRADAANDEAVNNIVYRSMNPDTRYWFLHGVSADDVKKLAEQGITAEPWVGFEEDSGIERKVQEVKGKDGNPRMKDGVPVTKFIESEEVFYNRALAELVESKKYASEDAARAHYQPIIERVATYAKMDPTEWEAAERGPKKLAAKYKVAAAKSLSLGTWEKVNTNMLSKIGKSFTPTADTSKMFEGKYPTSDGKEVPFNVSDKDAEALGWLIKEFQDWKSASELAALTE